MAAEDGSDFEALLELIRASRGFDFTGYKRPSLVRRIDRRMQAVRTAGYDEYRHFLAEHPEEFNELFNTILINVTAFFRDAPAWDVLRREIVPRILESSEGRSIRVWSAGCASGEEAYTLAIVLAEAMPSHAFSTRVKIYATDVDEDALTEGRHGTYVASKLENMPQELRERYFERLEQHYLVKPELRRVVIFGRHDVVRDPPISRVDLLSARNTLMYFTPGAQDRILAGFHFALRESGFLFLGKSETLMTRTTLFTPVDRKRRIFVKVPQVTDFRPLPPAERPSLDRVADELMRDVGFETGPIAQLVVDGAGTLTLANLQARALFGLHEADVGRPLRDLEISYRPLELRSQIEAAESSGDVVQTRDVEWHAPGGERRVLDVQVAPLLGAGGAFVGVAVAFLDVTRHKQVQDVVERSKRELETAYEELQSTNEELETTNEELQSTNEELGTINDELNVRTDELDHANAFLASVLQGLDAGVVVLDDELRVAAWNGGAHELWGLDDEEVQGQHFMNLDIGLPVERLRAPLRAVLAGRDAPEPLVLEARNRRGRTIGCRVSLSPLQGANGAAPRGVIVFMEAVEA